MAGPAHAVLLTTCLSGQLTSANPDLATQGSEPYGHYMITYGSATRTNTCTTFDATMTELNNFVFGDAKITDLNLSSAARAGPYVADSGSISLTQDSGGQMDGFARSTSPRACRGARAAASRAAATRASRSHSTPPTQRAWAIY